MARCELSRRLRAAEDIKVGDHVAVLRALRELVPWMIEPGIGTQEIDPTRVWVMPEDAGRPLRVVGVCLPFVMVQDVDDGRFPLDTRRHVLAKVSAGFAKSAKRPESKRAKRAGKKKRHNVCEL